MLTRQGEDTMEKGTGMDFLKALILGALMIAFITLSPMMASETPAENIEAPLSVISPETVIIDTGFTPPESSTSVGFEQMSLGETEITSPSVNLPLVPTKINLQAYSILPTNLSSDSIRKGNFGFTAALASTVLLHAADYYSTVNALKYDQLQEGNPFMKKIVNNQLLFGAIKLGVAGLQVTLLRGLYKKNKTLAWVAGTVMNVALSYVVANNFSKIQRAKACAGI